MMYPIRDRSIENQGLVTADPGGFVRKDIASLKVYSLLKIFVFLLEITYKNVGILAAIIVCVVICVNFDKIIEMSSVYRKIVFCKVNFAIFKSDAFPLSSNLQVGKIAHTYIFYKSDNIADYGIE